MTHNCMHLVLDLWLTVEESDVSFVSRMFVGLRQIIKESVDFVCSSVVHWTKWLILITLLNTSLSREFCSEMLLKIGENTFK